MDLGEEIGEAAAREVYEETGVDTEVVSLVALREAHGASAGGGGAAALVRSLAPRRARAYLITRCSVARSPAWG